MSVNIICAATLCSALILVETLMTFFIIPMASHEPSHRNYEERIDFQLDLDKTDQQLIKLLLEGHSNKSIALRLISHWGDRYFLYLYIQRHR